MGVLMEYFPFSQALVEDTKTIEILINYERDPKIILAYVPLHKKQTTDIMTGNGWE